eukprot:CAMPEP_0182475930 /NCGR_PEP_ID=MMETSP1319-20130603/28187_1 /TAXON_ID=172717 /ORGANISM="Bolidomonas pacifica, Strain RCC208" /LENGTH=420 /DNA_ID=CAMNT_0024676971 /DNA_START=57 /DNA_END=1316 /DNA_ORIENTATION=-
MTNNIAKSTKGPFMRIGNTFIRCFIFALRQLFLISILLYIFTCYAQSLLHWVPCTLYADRPETVDLDMIFPTSWECQENEVQHGFLNVSLIFRNFGSTFTLMIWCFLARDPQEVFSYVIQLADLDQYKEEASKSGIFTFFYIYWMVMILFVYNFVTAEVMQICDLLRFNMLHQVEVVFLRPKGHDFFYCIEWQLNMTSQRGGMIIEYYSKRLHQAQTDGITIDRIDDKESSEYTREKGSFLSHGLHSAVSGGTSRISDLPHFSIAEDDDDDDDDDEEEEEEEKGDDHDHHDSISSQDSEVIVKRGEAGIILGGNEHLGTAKGRLTDDKIGIENPMSVRRANPVTNLRTSKYGPSGHQSGRMSSGVVSGRRDTLRVTRTGKPGSLDMLSNLVTKRDLPSGQVLVDPIAEQVEKSNKREYHR